MAERLYLGVDVAGATNTWAAALAPRGDGADLAWGPEAVDLSTLFDMAAGIRPEHVPPVAGVAIDAQLTASLDDRTGFRTADLLLRAALPDGCQDWVQSINSLLAVPVRGQMLADALAPHVGTVLETHPRACLAFALGPAALPQIRAYKASRSRAADPEAARLLWARWLQEFSIAAPPPAPGWAPGDGAVDALVCATVAWLYHRDPDALQRFGASSGARGRGPLYVLEPRRAPRNAAPSNATSSVEQTGAPAAVAVLGPETAHPAAQPARPTSSTPAPPGSGPGDVVVPTAATRYADVRGRAVQCPACRRDVLRQWPSGWDAHAAHTCAGATGATPEERKDDYRTRFGHLFRPGA